VTLPGAVRVVLLDIEGTTTPIAFVHDRLFGYVRSHLPQYVASHWNDAPVREVIRQLNDERAPEGWNPIAGPDALLGVVRDLMDRDRKSPGLKTLQGLIWEDGYQAGELRGEVFDDVPVAMRLWRSEGREIAIYSSGSEMAQRRLFESTAAGDLTPLITAFFDTRVGAKVEVNSYTKIAQALGQSASSILFVSDVTAELRAARAAGLDVVLSVRPGNSPQADAHLFPAVSTLTGI
jgi:enolase-phosphatase E1